VSSLGGDLRNWQSIASMASKQRERREGPGCDSTTARASARAC